MSDEAKERINPTAKGYVKIGGADIFYQVFGQKGPYVVLLHGNGEDYRCFSNQLEAFSQSFQLVAIDSRGHGRSSMGWGRLTLEKMAEDVIGVMDELQIATASIVGFSDGGNIAIELGLRFPKRVEKLVLAGANLDPKGLAEKFQKAVAKKYRHLWLCGLFSREIRKKAKIMGLMVNQPHFTPDQLAKIIQPVLVLAGDRDLILSEHTELIAESLPGGRLQIIPDSDHFIFRRKPEEVNRLVLDFLT